MAGAAAGVLAGEVVADLGEGRHRAFHSFWPWRISTRHWLTGPLPGVTAEANE
jgi:hypothetical protein